LLLLPVISATASKQLETFSVKTSSSSQLEPLMFQDQLNPIWYNVWLDPNLRNKTMNLPLELHLLLQYSYVCIRHDSCIQCINSLPKECCSISYMTFVGECNTVMSSGH
ncbi:unnamed protein product, partial [Pocillopora meandrina]